MEKVQLWEAIKKMTKNKNSHVEFENGEGKNYKKIHLDDDGWLIATDCYFNSRLLIPTNVEWVEVKKSIAETQKEVILESILKKNIQTAINELCEEDLSLGEYRDFVTYCSRIYNLLRQVDIYVKATDDKMTNELYNTIYNILNQTAKTIDKIERNKENEEIITEAFYDLSRIKSIIDNTVSV